VTTADNFDLGLRADHAVYLPAINGTMPRVVDSPLDASRPFPAGFDVTDLAFWTGTSRLFNHKFLLHSVGNYKIGAHPKFSIFHRKPNSFTFVGDSGGFQIGKGTLEGLKGFKEGMDGDAAVASWNKNFDAKVWIINWLDMNCDYAMTLDMPLWANTPSGLTSPFHKCTDQQLLDMTLDNLKIIERHMTGRTKWLNAIQGTTPQNTQTWWDAVKYFRHGGWSLAGAAGWRGGLYNMLTNLLRMRDENAFEKGHDWVHVLGVSTAMWSILLTAIQKQLRQINENIQVSFDSASHVQAGAARDQYSLPPALTKDVRDWAMSHATLPTTRHYADPANPIPFPASSPIGNNFHTYHLVVRDADFKHRRLDDIGSYLIVSHNIWVYLDTFRRANTLAFSMPDRPIPGRYAAALDVIEKVFNCENWVTELDKHKTFLDDLAKSQY
jgi:hypothetical protein